MVNFFQADILHHYYIILTEVQLEKYDIFSAVKKGKRKKKVRTKQKWTKQLAVWGLTNNQTRDILVFCCSPFSFLLNLDKTRNFAIWMLVLKTNKFVVHFFFLLLSDFFWHGGHFFPLRDKNTLRREVAEFSHLLLVERALNLNKYFSYGPLKNQAATTGSQASKLHIFSTTR